jgi:hypothetical protein
LLKAYLSVLDEYTALYAALFAANGQLQFDATRLLTNVEELLEAQLAHLDDCYYILKALYPPMQVKNPSRFADKWLEQAGHPTVKAFSQAITKYREETLAPIVNRVKHEHGRLRCVIFYGQRARYAGYYVEGVDSNDAIGPDPIIHPGNTALSLNRDLRYHFASLYVVDEHLRQAIVAAMRKQQGVRTLAIPRIEQVDPAVVQVAQRISALPMVFYPDEVQKPCPIVTLTGADAKMELSATYPSAEIPFGPGSLRVQTIVAGDGVSRTFRMPYMASTIPHSALSRP